MSRVEKFHIYRPPTHTGRLEGVHHVNPNVWAPSVSYKYSLYDIRDQATPAQALRDAYITLGKEVRIIRRLEARIKRNVDAFVKGAVRVQAAYRGMKRREFFRGIKELLVLQKRQRDAIRKSKEEFQSGSYLGALEAIEKTPTKTIELKVMQSKILYLLSRFDECDVIAREIVGG